MDKSGIYYIRNKENGKIYVGSSLSVFKRFRTHKSLLNRNRHHAYKLQAAWNKYTPNNFEFLIVEEIFFNRSQNTNYKIQILECIEQYYLDLNLAAAPYNYNTSPKAGQLIGLKTPREKSLKGHENRRKLGTDRLSDTHKSNISISLKNSKIFHEGLKVGGLKRRIKVDQFDKTGKLIKNWNSIQEIVESDPTLFKFDGIRKSIDGNLKSYKGFIFSKPENK